MFKANRAFALAAAGVFILFPQPGCNQVDRENKAPPASLPVFSKPISTVDLSSAKHAIAACNDFAFDLYLQLAKENKGDNLFFSPYSLASALTIAAQGAEGETATEMGSVLRFPDAVRRASSQNQTNPWKTDQIHVGMSILYRQFSPTPVQQEFRDRLVSLRNSLDRANKESKDLDDAGKRREAYVVSLKARKIAMELNSLLTQVDQYEIRVANGLWGEQTYPFDRTFLETVRRYYGPETIFAVDFKNMPEETRQRINQSVEETTNRRIRDFLPSGLISPATRLILTNAIYFKGEWQDPFEETQTKEDDFTTGDGTKIRVAMMHDRYMAGEKYAAFQADGTFFPTPKEVPAGRNPDPGTVYPEAGGFQMLELPYKGGDLSMIVILPQSADGLNDLEKKMNSQNFWDWTDKLEIRAVDVYLPKFKLEATYPLKETLKQMGMARPFADPGSPEGAQFNGMSASHTPEFSISEVLHKAYVEVNEKGTEAAAATFVMIDIADGSMDEPTRPFDPTFRADRPFLFLIRDIQTGTILFLGKMIRPTD